MDNLDMFRKHKRIALMGGTFDPIHYGHLVTAEAVRFQYHIDKVVFLPSGRPPHKKGVVTESCHRYHMTKQAIETNPDFAVSDMEIKRKGYTYTIDTLELIKSYQPEAELFFITGADAVHEILTWKQAQKVLALCTFIAVSRPGYAHKNLIDHIGKLNDGANRKIEYLEVPSLAISSTDIRRRVEKGVPIKYLLPETVETYIYDNKLYAKEM